MYAMTSSFSSWGGGGTHFIRFRFNGSADFFLLQWLKSLHMFQFRRLCVVHLPKKYNRLDVSFFFVGSNDALHIGTIWYWKQAFHPCAVHSQAYICAQLGQWEWLLFSWEKSFAQKLRRKPCNKSERLSNIACDWMRVGWAAWAWDGVRDGENIYTYNIRVACTRPFRPSIILYLLMQCAYYRYHYIIFLWVSCRCALAHSFVDVHK